MMRCNNFDSIKFFLFIKFTMVAMIQLMLVKALLMPHFDNFRKAFLYDTDAMSRSLLDKGL